MSWNRPTSFLSWPSMSRAGISILIIWASKPGGAVLITDLDGDGTVELLRSAPDYFHGAVILPRGNPSVTGQVNFPRKYGEGARQVDFSAGGKALSGPFQLDDDDQLEILAVGTTLDRRSWGFWTSEFSMEDGFLRLREDRVFFP